MYKFLVELRDCLLTFQVTMRHRIYIERRQLHFMEHRLERLDLHCCGRLYPYGCIPYTYAQTERLSGDIHKFINYC